MSTTISVDTALFRDALKKCVSDKTAAQPIYRHVLIRGGDGKIELISTDECMLLEYTLAAILEGEAPNFTANVNLMASALNGLDGLTRLVHDGENLRLHNGNRRYKIDTLPGDQFPTAPALNGEDLDLSPASLREAIRVADYCMSQHDMAHPYTNGLWLCPDYIVSFNGVAMACMPLNTHVPDRYHVIIPSSALRKNFASYLQDAAGIRLLIRGDEALALHVAGEDYRLRVRLLDCKYPEGWRGAAKNPSSFAQHITLDTQVLLGSLQRIMPFASQVYDGYGVSKRTSGCFVRMIVKNGELKLQSRDNENAVESLPCEHVMDIEVAIDATLLKRVVDVGGDMIIWHHNDAATSQCFTFPGREDAHYLMPMRI
jgi:DNA polymerase III sliding clamp (beta) subunit (PCNA family)